MNQSWKVNHLSKVIWDKNIIVNQIYQFYQNRLVSPYKELKISEFNILAVRLMKRIPSMLDEIEQKPCKKTKKVIEKGQKSNTEWSKASRKHK